MKTKILLDMDGVLANFVQGACDFLKVDNPYRGTFKERTLGSFDILEHLGMSPGEQDDFYDDINNVPFWEHLGVLPEACAIVAEAEAAVGTKNVCLLSSPSHMEFSMVGKVRWIRKHFPQFQDRYLFGKQKQFCADTVDHILIDDYEKNVDAFRAHGGQAFLVPRPWNKDHANEPILVDLLSKFLGTYDH